jgi:putative membrane protein
MTKLKRYSPLIILFDLGRLLKNSFFFVIYLYVIKANSISPIIKYGRVIFLIVLGLTFFSIIYKWFTHKYKLDEQSFHLYTGLFSKSERTIPFSKVQNVNRHTSLFHRIFKMTSIHFETAVTGDHATVKFEVISQKDAKSMEAHLRNIDQDTTDLNQEYDDPNPEIEHQDLDRTIHFQPTKGDVLKASFTSLSFLVLIPLIGSLYYSLDGIFQIEGVAKDFFEWTISSWWVIPVLAFTLLLASITFGIIRAFVKYGKYEISSDAHYIYIAKGMIDETAFSISKEKVQAIVIEQTVMKRLLGLAGVKLRSAGGLSLGDDTLEINTLYPFLPVDQAYKIIAEILPSYTISQEMNKLPRKSFWVRILSPSWLWLIATGALLYFKPTILNIEQTWFFISIALLICILILRVLDFTHTRYLINEQFIQFKTGALTTSLFISKREKVIEVGITRNIIQKKIGLASVETINRGSPVHHTDINDLPIEVAHDFFHWYVNRKNEVRIE